MLTECIHSILNVGAKSSFWHSVKYSTTVANALRRKKKKSSITNARPFLDVKVVRTAGGKGGNGCVSFLKAYTQEHAGPDGGDGGHGAHVIFRATNEVRDLIHVPTVLKGDCGEKGYNKDCCGRNASHTVVPVPIGTVIRNKDDQIVADLNEPELMFVAARGGAGGRGNHFFATDVLQAPKVAEYGADGENYQYILEVACIANFGMLGFPNAGKSTLLQAISRAKPKVASYPFTTVQPHVGMIEYDDYEQIAVADLPGIIEGSHRNRGLGIQFLRHAKRCAALLMVVDTSLPTPWETLEKLRFELQKFDESMSEKPQIIVANKMDLKESKENLEDLKQIIPNDIVIPVSAKHGTNLTNLLTQMKILYDQHKANEEEKKENNSMKEIPQVPGTQELEQEICNSMEENQGNEASFKKETGNDFSLT